jgi:hypothetical protein
VTHEPDPPLIEFTSVPRQRRRRVGWTEERQRGFIAALAECGSVSRAARAVGMTSRSAYRLMDSDGADDFARAWDQAIDIGIERVRAEALRRALNGSAVAVYRRGKLIRVETRFNDRLAIALLNGKDKAIDDYRRTAVSRRAYRQELKAHDEAKAERKAEYQRELDRIIESARPRREPSVRML